MGDCRKHHYKATHMLAMIDNGRSVICGRKVLQMGVGAFSGSAYSSFLAARSAISDMPASKAAKGALNWTTISDGAPEAGGGGASAATGIEGGAPAGAGSDDDDDGGDADPEPARRRPHTNGTAPVSGETLLRLRGVQARVPLSKSAIYKLIAENRFPQPIRLSARCSLWRASEIDAFVSSLA